MSLWRQVTRGLSALVNRRSADRELTDEMDHFLEQAVAAHVASGMTPADARRRARLEMGSASSVRQEVRGSGWESSLESFAADVRYAVRSLRKRPMFAAVIILVISLGTGAVTTIFSATNAMLLRPLPGARDAHALFSVDRKHRNGTEGMSASWMYYTALRDGVRSFDGVAAWSELPLTVTIGGSGTLAYGNAVSASYFPVLGVHPEIGRFFTPEEDRTPSTNPVLVISDGFWRSAFGGDSSVIGRTVPVNGHPFTIIGVVPRTFRGVYIPLKSDAWVPLMMLPQLHPGHDLNDLANNDFRLFARVRPGVTRERAQEEASSVTAAWVATAAEPMPWAKEYTDARLVPLSGLPEDATKAIVGFFFLLLGASALVLLIASVNVGAMLSARGVARTREMAVRAALGARKGRLVRQLLTESLVLFLLGSAGGIGIAVAATRALQRLPLPDQISLDLVPDYRVIGFALGVALVTGVVFGLAPALQAARADVSTRIREDSPSGGMRRSRIGNVLIVAQLALSLVLLVGAGLFLRALSRGNQIDPGFDSTGISVATFDTESWGYDEAQARAFYQALRERLTAMPGVSAVTFADVIPLTAQNQGMWVYPDAAAARGGSTSHSRVRTEMAFVGADYFATLHMPLVAGRPVVATDDAHANPVAVVNETFARKLWPNGSAVGRTFVRDSTTITVVGVARDAKYAWLAEAKTPFAYFPVAQQWAERQALFARSNANPVQRAAAIERVVRSIDAGLPRPVVTTLREENAIVLLPQRVAAMVTGALGAIGLLMATVGLYGIISYSVNRRGREIGIRVALGARRQDVLSMVVREGLRLAVVGVAIGLIVSMAATRLMASFLFGVSPLDLVTFVGMSLLFLGIAFVSSYLPARRAAAVDPMTALRVD